MSELRPAPSLLAALAPLRFAARKEFAQLKRVKDLEPTLSRALERVQRQGGEVGARAGEMLALLPGAGADQQVRIAQLGRLLHALEAWNAQAPLGSAPASAAVEAPSAAGAKAPALAAAGAPSPAAAKAAPPAPAKARKGTQAASSAPAASAQETKPAARSKAPARKKTAATAPPTKPGPPAKLPTPRPLTGEVVPPLDESLQYVRGVGPRMAEALATRSLHTVKDLLHFFPRRYQGQSGEQAIADLVPDVVASVEGQVVRVADRFVKGRHSLEVVLEDPTGTLHLVWFRVPGRGFASQFKRGNRYRVAGTVKRFRQALQIAHPELRRIEDIGVVAATGDASTPAPVTAEMFGRGGEAAAATAPGASVADAIVPLYLDVEGLHPNQLRRLIAAVLPALVHLQDPLPKELRHKRGLVSLAEALRFLHAPPADTDANALEAQATPGHRRLIYDECFFLQLGLLFRRAQGAQKQDGIPIHLPASLAQLAKELLPFALTQAQARAVGDVERDMTLAEPMQRLLQGDVGSGKTAVALVAAAATARAGLQAAIMAPTELLAEQHARNFTRLLAPHGIRVLLHTGQQPGAERRQNLALIASGEAQVVIGTHALIQNDVAFARLGLAVIDEQHRFGVLQRARLRAMGEAGLGKMPHLLVMTATPIPRTLALTVYGDLELTLIDELPPGRTPVTTKLFNDAARAQVYEAVRAAVAEGRQAYVVFPLVEASDKEGMAEIRAASEQAGELAAGALSGLRLGLLHGRLSREEKDAVMQAFVRHEVDVLIATTVIEVGIDVGNASVMVVEHAERFGLSQLHQLRGRVGRGAAESFCYLLARFRPSETAWRRLAIMEQSSDGFRIAEEDLAIRGPGDFIGTRQSGLPVLSMTNLARDGALLVQARDDARALLAEDPTLVNAGHAHMRQRLAELWQQRLQLVRLA